MTKPLTVYKASAGSGKTFRLAVEYIKLLIDNPNAYRNILAVTFTNKATEEMKNRILSQLYGIWKRLPESQDYMDKVTSELNINEDFASERARIALGNLIHNYSYFRVETIDSFFQSVLRNLARELDLTANLRIELNDQQVEQQAVDELIESLSPSSIELGWILSFIRENIEDDKTWNVIGQMKKFGENIFKDIYKDEHEKLNSLFRQGDFFKNFTGRIRTIRDDARKKLMEPAQQFQQHLSNHGIDETAFTQGKKGPAGYFKKLLEGTFDDDKLLNTYVKAALDDPMKWLKKADQDPSTPLGRLVVEHIAPLLSKSEQHRPSLLHLYKSADLTLRYMNQLRLLNSIDERVRQMNKDANRFLLSDTQTLLNSLIQDSDSPFIFEKIGTQLQHVMIDEFQDTSTVQWQNFKVLLKECMSQDASHDLIVGDVKQSIYRWRSGDWRLLNDIEGQFSPAQMQTISLQTNYRSSRNIISFNNAFFQQARQAEINSLADNDPEGAKQLERAYSDVIQECKDNADPNGLIQVELLPAQDYQDVMMQRLHETLSMLFQQGVAANDIAILVRSNNTIQSIAEYLTREMPEAKLISDEAFRLDASLAVNVLIKSMRALAHPEDLLTRAELAKAYQTKLLGNDFPDQVLFADINLINDLLPKEFTENETQLQAMPLHDLAERLYRIFGLNVLENESAYICGFYDQLAKFLTDNVADIEAFLTAWDDNIHRKTIQSDASDGIRLLTIHKSKGLEYDNVIIPFCDWKLEKTSLIWCKPESDEKPFNELPIVPIDFNARKMMGTIYESDYLHEHLQNTVDNLNLLYVAFTRARKNLFVFGRRGLAGTRSKLIEDVLPLLSSELPDCTIEGTGDKNDESIVFSFGNLALSDNKKATPKAKPSANVFNADVSSITMQVDSFESNIEFRQSNKSRDFIEGDEEEEQQKRFIKTGTILHNIFSTIKTHDDVGQALLQLENDGILYDSVITKERLFSMIEKRLNSEKVSNWFSGKWKLYNECTILVEDPLTHEVHEYRPDRVMTNGKETIVVDFKFGKSRPEYLLQVKHYMTLLNEMGHTNVKGFLWYVYNNVIEEVDMHQ